jgi:hypothetical protein
MTTDWLDSELVFLSHLKLQWNFINGKEESGCQGQNREIRALW